MDFNITDSPLIVNHFEYNREICNKAYLIENIQSFNYVLLKIKRFLKDFKYKGS